MREAARMPEEPLLERRRAVRVADRNPALAVRLAADQSWVRLAVDRTPVPRGARPAADQTLAEVPAALAHQSTAVQRQASCL